MSRYVIVPMDRWDRNFWNDLPLHDVDELATRGNAMPVIVEDGQITAYEMEVEP